MPPTSFRRASARRVNMKVNFWGPSKVGKTYQAILAARRFLDRLATSGQPTGNNRIAVIDSENGRSEYYANLVDFDIYDLYQVKPESYIEAFNEAAAGKYGVIVVDSISHEWAGKGGLMDFKDSLIKSGSVRNDFAAFGQVTPRHNEFIDAIVRYPGHLFATTRGKTDYALNNVNGKMVPEKIGLGLVQRDGIEYEFDVVVAISSDHSATFECRGILGEKLNRRFSPEEMITVFPDAMADFILGNHSETGAAITGADVLELKKLGADLLEMGESNWIAALKGQGAASWDALTRDGYETIKKGIVRAHEKRKKDKEAAAQA